MKNAMFKINSGRFGEVGCITLSRPDKLNAINHAMFQSITTHLLDWLKVDDIKCVVIDSSVKNCFSAGGDLQEIFAKRKNIDSLQKYFFDEYRLIKFLNEYPKPVISILDGYTFGGGVGLGMHVKYPCVTSNFVFAMPENLIGLFPDVGGRYISAKLPNNIGRYLALTGRKINYNDAIQIGLVNYSINCSSSDFKDKILQFDSIKKLELYIQDKKISGVHTRFNEFDKVDYIFSLNDIDDIVCALKQENTAWTKGVLQELKMCSPLSLQVTLMAMDLAKEQTLQDCLFTDYRIVNRMLVNEDFFEGIRAKIIDKDNSPVWVDSDLDNISKKDIIEFFSPLETEINWI
ncbi:MAG: enoyl-CoA hydratase/isomerase family protein [Legionellales bacterium]|nr:enoyl-CoA hydratase/isomerase family protein [Legionellales bacterium]